MKFREIPRGMAFVHNCISISAGDGRQIDVGERERSVTAAYHILYFMNVEKISKEMTTSESTLWFETQGTIMILSSMLMGRKTIQYLWGCKLVLDRQGLCGSESDDGGLVAMQGQTGLDFRLVSIMPGFTMYDSCRQALAPMVSAFPVCK